nr:O-antigen ligase family protein [uncultured Flavobacterium sp.]
MKGNTGNINILAASLSIKVPFILLGISHFKKYKKWFLVLALFSVTSVIFLTGARTALINLFVIYLVYIVYLLKEFSFTRAVLSKVLYILIPILTALLFSNSIFEKSKDKSRYVSIENRINQINTHDESANARLFFWKNAITLIEKDPLTGIGLGNYQVESIPYERTFYDDSTVSLHTHNDFLEIMSETGVINGLVYISLFIILLINNLKIYFSKSSDENKKQLAILALLILVVYGLDSLFNFPMYRPTMQIFFALLLAFTVINHSKEFLIEPRKIGVKIICSLLIVTAIVTTYSSFLIYKASNLEYLISNDDINNSDKKDRLLTGDEVVERIPAYPNVLNTSESFYEYAGIYYIRENNFKKALNCFAKASKINPYSGRIEFYKQTIASRQGKIDSAYIYSKKAFYLRPRNYALYKSAMYYSVTKNDTVELLKEHKLFSQYRNEPQEWVSVATVLQRTGATPKRLLNFVNQGLKKIPNDTSLLRKKNEFLIASYLQGGQNFEAKSELVKALKSYENALKIDPKNTYISQNIGFNYLKQGQNKKAITSLLDALKTSNLKDGKTEFFLGICYLKENDKTNAWKYFNISRDKNYLPAKQLISRAYNNNGQNQFKKRDNDLLIADYITKGQKFEEEKKFDQALIEYEKALKIDPKSIYASQNVGFYYLKTGNFKKAINYLVNALKYPGLNDGKTEYFLAVCYLKQNEKDNACKYLTISKNKNYPDAANLVTKLCN